MTTDNSSTIATRPDADTPPRLGRNVLALSAVSFFTDASSEMIYPLLPLFLGTVLHAGAGYIGTIEGAAESTAALVKLASGWWSDRVRKRKPLVVAGYTIASAVRPLVGLASLPGQVLAIRLADRVGKGIRSSPRDALIADSAEPALRGRAFGFHRAADHFGAVIGPLVASAMLRWLHVPLQHVFLWAAVPGAIAVALAVLVVRERDAGAAPAAAAPRATRATRATRAATPRDAESLPRRFWAVLVAIVVFTLGNSTDAFLLLRASQLGVAAAWIPILWAALHVVKSASSTPGGALSDRIGRRPLIVGGWLLYAAVYLLFGRATATWQAWALFGVYGLYFGLTEGTEKALIADLVPAARRGAAFGWYNLALGLAAFPASVLFGFVWERRGAPAAFALGAALAAAAAVMMAIVAPPRPQQQRAPAAR